MIVRSDAVRRLLNARSVAVVGASSDPTKLTGRPIAYMQGIGFDGDIYPVNPSRPEIQGLRSYPSLSAIGRPVDLAIIGTAAERVEEAVTEGIAAGVGGFVIFSSGFAEFDADGAERQRRLTELSRHHGVPIIGPNCLGVINARSGLVASFTTAMEGRPPKPGHFAFVSQSGAMAAYWLDMVTQAGIGVSTWVSSGNECDLTIGDVLGGLADDDDTRVIGLYMEDIKDPPAFRAVARRLAEAGKPVIAIKAGRSKAGADAARSHTGALAGEDTLYEALFDQYAIERVDSLTALIDRAKPFLFDARPRGRRLAVLSVSGGAGVMLADAAEAAGMEILPFADETRQQLAAVLPVFSKPQNPIDLTAMVVQDPALLSKTLTVIGEASEIDACVLFVGLMASIADTLAAAIGAARAASGKPVVVVWIGARSEVVGRLQDAGLPVFADIPAAIDALAGSLRFDRRQQALRRLPTGLPSQIQPDGGTRMLTEWDSKALLRAGDHAVPLPRGVLIRPDEGADGLAGLTPPFVAKLQSPTLPHKSDAGGVVLRLKDAAAVMETVRSFEAMARERGIPYDGTLVEEMVPFDMEFLVGIRRDSVFGPVVVVGRGGVEVEAMGDVAMGLLPLDRAAVVRLIRSLRCAPLLDGFRNRAAVPVEALADAIVGLCERFLADGRLAEIEINPLVAGPHGVAALDALLTVAGNDP
ncbi:acetate--CoA ligase family protein [Azospirillum sp.]|uniref:acetate--CoA ligase family protein n=1 Tax=Azospirillum sp. TaxID=34012 RepID=UPI002D62F5AA|nr:acetate--CoA ligase family protein [Azospirillum sp.]HYD71138.1 acetate--CoA ligase family protein [Azospirillum sp.]HYH23212.1 acetate--CoA ligase family protein [Azospirillum sp.]